MCTSLDTLFVLAICLQRTLLFSYWTFYLSILMPPNQMIRGHQSLSRCVYSLTQTLSDDISVDKLVTLTLWLNDPATLNDSAVAWRFTNAFCSDFFLTQREIFVKVTLTFTVSEFDLCVTLTFKILYGYGIALINKDF